MGGDAVVTFVWVLLFSLNASTVAEKIYFAGNQYLATEEVSKAKEAFEVANLLERCQERSLALLGRGSPKVPGSFPDTDTFPLKSKITEAKKFLEQGERAQAILVLNEIVEKNPANERAKIFLEQLKTEEKTKQADEGFSEAIEERFKKAKQLWEDGKKEKSYPKLTAALALFKSDDLKPSFYGELTAEQEKLAEVLRREILPKLKAWEQTMASPSADFKRIGLKLREVQKNYPPMTEVEGLLVKVYEGLDQKAKPFFLEAKTILELEGCKKAVDKFTKAKEIATFSEVSVWREAERNLEACGGRENREPKTESREPKVDFRISTFDYRFSVLGFQFFVLDLSTKPITVFLEALRV